MTENVTALQIFMSSTLAATTSDLLEQNTNSTLPTLLPTTLASATTSKTTDATDTDIEPDDSGHFILIPLTVLLLIVALSALVFLIGRNRRRLARIYCRRRSERKYSLEDDSDTPMEQGDDYDFDDPSECLLKGKLQIDNSYASTLRKELYT
ncbi:uncharacterized protein LOC118740717 [Rhagoletis pomonella]|uniref:uncharacterized protein LOC118740717 n=1 Tax=Rhagoletis pomonella TaxID=28610 RepID=UPI00177BBB67|nr:uncharacterized protein LOC118740717 [Rhagoletis pomonella]